MVHPGDTAKHLLANVTLSLFLLNFSMGAAVNVCYIKKETPRYLEYLITLLEMTQTHTLIGPGLGENILAFSSGSHILLPRAEI